MSPARIEFEHPITKEWVLMVEGIPGTSGSLSHNNPDGSREIYKVDSLADDSETAVSKSIGGSDMEIGEGGREIITKGFIPVARLKDGETFEMDIKPDSVPTPVHIRVTYQARQI